MTIIVTGATGFVGRKILAALTASDSRIRIIVRDASSLGDTAKGTKIEVRESPNLFKEDQSRLEELLTGSDVLIHAAWYAEPGKYLDSPKNLECLTGTVNLASAFAAVGGKRFVGIGTCAEYAPTDSIITTETPLSPDTLYAACKASAYLVLRKFFEAADISFAWCRLFYLYGDGEDPRRLVPYIRASLEAGEEALLTEGRQVRDFMDVTEAGRLISRVAEGSRAGAVNICSGNAVSIRQLAERIADEYGRRDLLRFGSRPDNAFDPPSVVGEREDL